MLEARDISKSLGGRAVLDRVSLCCAPPEVIMLTGENGSGKTTLLRILAGIIEPSHGTVQIGGYCLARQPLLAKARMGYMPDTLEAVPELLVSELIALVAALKTNARREAATVDAIWKERLGVSATWGQRLRSLSFGQRKRVALFAALVGNPELLLMDEPSSGLDPGGVDLIRALVEERRRAGLVTVISTNDVELERSVRSTRHHLAFGKLEDIRAEAAKA